MNSYVQMRCYDNQQNDEEDTSALTSVPLPDNLTTPTVHIRSFPVGGGDVNCGGVWRCWRRLKDRWQSYSVLERSLLLVIVALVAVVAVALPPALAYFDQRVSPVIRLVRVSHDLNQSKIEECSRCTTGACVSAAAGIMAAMDPTADPCQDFYQYSCGQWIRQNPIPEGKSIWGTFDQLWQSNQVVMKTVLEQPASALVSEAERKAQMYYQSCLDVNETMEALGGEPILQLLSTIGGWPALGYGAGADADFNLQHAIQIAHHELNVGGLFTWGVAEDDKNSSRHVIQMDQGGLTLPNRDYYLNKTDNDEILLAYSDYMTKLAVLLNSTNVNETRRQVQSVIDLETRIAQITVPSSERRDEEKLYHSLTVADLNQMAPFLNWTAFFQSAFNQVNISITGAHAVVVYSPDFLRNLSNIIQQLVASKEGRKTMHNYLAWHTVRYYLTCLPKSFRDAGKILRKALMGSDGTEEVWRSCVTDTYNVLGFAVGAMFIRENFHGESKPLAEAMISQVKEAFKTNFKNLDWMDEETRQAARDKADAISDMIGFPKFILGAKDLDAHYADLNIRSSEYFYNNVQSGRFTLRQNLVKLNEPVNKTIWGMTPPTVNAYYTPNKNQIVFPAGILQKPFYDISFPSALNFGAMGVVMGHELTHAFDDQGREFDKDGDLAPWWNNGTVDRFQKRTECLVRQYNSFTINSEHLNGKQTLGENIADNGGLKAAFHAFESWSQDHQELMLPGLNLTHQQLFFISFAQVWCSASTKEALHLQILNDPHSPARYRVVGPLSNLASFSQVFQCPAGSLMNPKDKCEIW